MNSYLFPLFIKIEMLYRIEGFADVTARPVFDACKPIYRASPIYAYDE